MVTLPSVGSLASSYLSSFNDDFDPKTLKEAGLLSDAGVTLLASTPTANLAAQTAAMKEGFGLEKQKGVNETLLAIEEQKNERARKEAILNTLSGTTFAGDALKEFFQGSSDPYSDLAQQAAAKIAYEEPPSLAELGYGGSKEAAAQTLANSYTIQDLQKMLQQQGINPPVIGGTKR
tara:strand:- start:198 stop:728 length:531 start_codon:yes stop_codon:yes gene_type:complete